MRRNLTPEQQKAILAEIPDDDPWAEFLRSVVTDNNTHRIRLATVRDHAADVPHAVVDCPSCGGVHVKLMFQRAEKWNMNRTHFTTCPEQGGEIGVEVDPDYYKAPDPVEEKP